MSHMIGVNVIVRDMDALRASLLTLSERFGVSAELHRNTKARYFYGEGEEYPYVVKLTQGTSDVGFTEHRDSEGVYYQPTIDDYGQAISRHLGAKEVVPDKSKNELAIGKLMQCYAEETTKRSVQNQGYIVEQVSYDESQGKVHVVIAA